TFLDFRATLAGEEKTITISTLPIYDGSDWIGGMLLIDDVTTRERLRVQVILSEKLSSVGLLAAGVAHEINNPLEVVYNYLDWLGRRSKTKAMNDVLGNVKEEMNSIRQIVGNLITFSDVQQPIIEEIDAVSELRALVGLVDIEARRREVHIELTVAEEPVRITANRTEMKQVFLNIIKNSFEAMPGGGRLSISAGIERVKEHNQAVMSFRDTGGGISAANPTDIFLPFYSTKMANGRNLGLGLSITYNIVKKYRGLITVENTVPSGCCFTIRFPTN
ncbi:MAG: sensor histidine kinase, partial [Rectinemataceae bacterium]